MKNFLEFYKIKIEFQQTLLKYLFKKQEASYMILKKLWIMLKIFINWKAIKSLNGLRMILKLQI